MMTPEERAHGITKHLENPNFPGYTMLMPIDVIRDVIAAMIADAERAAVAAEREACAVACIAIADDRHDQYKGRPPYTPDNEHRADTYTEGESSGAELCAAAIRARS